VKDTGKHVKDLENGGPVCGYEPMKSIGISGLQKTRFIRANAEMDRRVGNTWKQK
jgi:hypothetical protein